MLFCEKAYAKINLSIGISGVRADGYHLMEMVMQQVSLCDSITLELTHRTRQTGGENTIALSCSDPALSCGEENTVFRAARLFFDACGVKGVDVHIHIDKRIPHQAGLGGGSADAAAVLRALNRAFESCLSLEKLCAIGERVGADVPFCIVGGTRLVTGIGERMRPLPPLPDCAIVLVKPAQGVSTREAFQAYDALVDKPVYDTSHLLRALDSGSLPQIGAQLFNVLEQVCRLPQVGQLKASLQEAGACGALMSGSGSAVFGLFGDEAVARTAADALGEQYVFSCVCRPIQED